jgi:hypothetical protein
MAYFVYARWPFFVENPCVGACQGSMRNAHSGIPAGAPKEPRLPAFTSVASGSVLRLSSSSPSRRGARTRPRGEKKTPQFVLFAFNNDYIMLSWLRRPRCRGCRAPECGGGALRRGSGKARSRAPDASGGKPPIGSSAPIGSSWGADRAGRFWPSSIEGSLAPVPSAGQLRPRLSDSTTSNPS